jgi:hypothetical protein
MGIKANRVVANLKKCMAGALKSTPLGCCCSSPSDVPSPALKAAPAPSSRFPSSAAAARALLPPTARAGSHATSSGIGMGCRAAAACVQRRGMAGLREGQRWSSEGRQSREAQEMPGGRGDPGGAC